VNTSTEAQGKQGRSRTAFTLIELLIVVAIIAILAAIAVPNFLEAQARAKISRAQADLRTVVMASTTYLMDNGKIYPDHNDSDSPSGVPTTFAQENPGVARDVKYVNEDMWFDGFYTFGVFRPLSTPVAYINTPAKDPFSKVMPIGIDTREIGAGNIVYAVLFISGPDVTDGDWYRGTSPTGKSIPYDATNGTKSRGDIWRSLVVKDMVIYKQEYGETFY
jgi:prepilin-type N-terminal cleavage/methylation domain-containing protein